MPTASTPPVQAAQTVTSCLQQYASNAMWAAGCAVTLLSTPVRAVSTGTISWQVNACNAFLPVQPAPTLMAAFLARTGTSWLAIALVSSVHLRARPAKIRKSIVLLVLMATISTAPHAELVKALVHVVLGKVRPNARAVLLATISHPLTANHAPKPVFPVTPARSVPPARRALS